MRGAWILICAAGCGRIGFDGLLGGGDDAPTGDAPADPDLLVHLTFDDASAGDAAGLLAPPSCDPGRCPSAVPGRIGNALAFDGVDDYLQFASPAALDFGGAGQPFSIALWFFATDLTPPTQRVLAAQATDGGQVSYQLAYEDIQGGGALDLVWKVCATGCLSEPFAIADDIPMLGRWVLLVATWDGTDTNLYLDAQLVASTPKPGIDYDGFPFMVGADYETGGSIEDSFAGSLDDLQIYRRALSIADQQKLLAQ